MPHPLSLPARIPRSAVSSRSPVLTNGTMRQNGSPAHPRRGGGGPRRRWSSSTRRQGDLLGACGLVEIKENRAEIGYWVTREARGRGVATRTVLLVTHWALT